MVGLASPIMRHGHVAADKRKRLSAAASRDTCCQHVSRDAHVNHSRSAGRRVPRTVPASILPRARHQLGNSLQHCDDSTSPLFNMNFPTRIAILLAAVASVANALPELGELVVSAPVIDGFVYAPRLTLVWGPETVTEGTPQIAASWIRRHTCADKPGRHHNFAAFPVSWKLFTCECGPLPALAAAM